MAFNYHQSMPFLLNFIKKFSTPCALCHSPSEDGICLHCFDKYFKHQSSRCECCANPLNINNDNLIDPRTILCGACLKKIPSFDNTIVASDYFPPLDQLIHLLKFQFNLAMAPILGNLIYQAILRKELSPNFYPDIIIAVPLGKQRLVDRGFNQSLEIAKTVARSLKVDLITNLVERSKETEKQSAISIKDRKKNVHNAFSIPHNLSYLIQGKHIGVVDDVMTTGNTLEEIASLLKKSSAKHITNLVFARTPKKNLKEK